MRSLAFCVLAVLFSPFAFGCVIEVPDEPQLIRDSSAIFEGILLEEDIGRRESVADGGFIVHQTFAIDVTRVWKGNVPRRVVVSKMDIIEQCVGSVSNFEYKHILFAPGARVIIYAKQAGPESYSMLPFGYALSGSNQHPLLLYKTYGQGNPP
jgi:hypothetical protein